MANCGIITIVNNEDEFIKMWYDYHSKHFDDKDIYIIDDASDQDHQDFPPVNIDRKKDFTPCITQIVNEKINCMMEHYDYLLYLDIDMFVVPDPEKYPEGLRQFLDQLKKPFVQCAGYDVHGLPEGGLDPDKRPLMSHFKYWHRDWRHLCKVVVFNEPPQYGGGFHHSQWTRGVGYAPEPGEHEDPDLRLIHMGMGCADLVKKRWQARQQEGRLPEDARKHVIGVWNDPYFEAERIPEKWRNAF